MTKRPLIHVLAAAVLFGLSLPFAKLLLRDIHPLVLSAVLYLGAFAGLTLYAWARKALNPGRAKPAIPLESRDRRWLAGAILAGGVLGPILLMYGLTRTLGFSASLLLNLEGLFTALIAVVLFKEPAAPRLWMALGFMTAAGIILSWDPEGRSISLSGPILVLAAMFCWALDNNLTRHISDKDPVLIAGIKGLCAGSITLIIALVLGIKPGLNVHLASGLLLGFVSYGLSLVFFIKALEGWGAARTGAFFGLAPFIAAGLSPVVLKETANVLMLPALVLMAAGAWLVIREKHGHRHSHEKTVHAHVHTHRDGHHDHPHPAVDEAAPHAHEHEHEELEHVHGHWPDSHHRHPHPKSTEIKPFP
jgi:drug/metabolite transporter (DMT)-like permease